MSSTTISAAFQSTLPARGATGINPFSISSLLFQSTLPARGATPEVFPASYYAFEFQSTLPARGATRVFVGQIDACAISIHAPCTGSDDYDHGQLVFHRISIHAPCTGSDGAMTTFFMPMVISIHAPCTGSDGANVGNMKPARNFNPRSLHGERPVDNVGIKFAGEFQSTLPARGATAPPVIAPSAEDISIHAPCTGSDRTWSPEERTVRNFNPRSLHGERRTFLVCYRPAKNISIHAPCTGSD